MYTAYSPPAASLVALKQRGFNSGFLGSEPRCLVCEHNNTGFEVESLSRVFSSPDLSIKAREHKKKHKHTRLV